MSHHKILEEIVNNSNGKKIYMDISKHDKKQQFTKRPVKNINGNIENRILDLENKVKQLEIENKNLQENHKNILNAINNLTKMLEV